MNALSGRTTDVSGGSLAAANLMAGVTAAPAGAPEGTMMTAGREGSEENASASIGRQLAFLAAVTEDLSDEVDYEAGLARVARNTVGELADICTIELTVDRATAPRQLAIAHVDPHSEDALSRVLRNFEIAGPSGPRRTALERNAPAVMPDLTPEFWDAAAADDEQRMLLRQLAIREVVAVPLLARGKVLGVLSLGNVRRDSTSQRTFSDIDVAVAGDLAARIAMAIDNARLYDAEQAARRAAELVASQLARLQIVTARLSQAQTVAEVAEIAVSDGAAGVDASGAALSLVAEDGQSMEVMNSFGFDPLVIESFRHFRLEDDLPAPDAVRSGEPVLLASIAERDARYPHLRGVQASNRSFASLPFSTEGRPIGVLTFAWNEDRPFSEDDRRFMFAVADQCGQALERARLAEAERLAAQRQRFLAEASRVLASSLDYEQTLHQMARLIVPELADAVSVYLTSDAGLRLITAVHADPEREQMMQKLAGREGQITARPQLLDVAATGRSRLLSEISDEQWESIALDAEHLSQLRRLDIRSSAVVALRARDHTLGVMTMTVGPSGRRYTEADLPILEDLASRIAVSIENARAHHSSQEVARMLQESLLPPHLLAVPGLEVAARYRPVADGSRVGGDFFDVFPAGRARWGVVMGDVCGQGVPAASLTAMARWTTRVAARQDERPSDVLRAVNQTVLEHDTDERFCTIALAFLEAAADGMRVTLSCGGHPPPLLLRPDGEVRPLGGSGTALGLFPEPELIDAEFRLRPGDALVFYTDGLTEARSPAGTFDPDLLASVLRRTAGLTAAELVAEVERTVIDFEGGRARDDMAILVVRVPSSALGPSGDTGSGLAEPAVETAAIFDERFPATPAAVAVARGELGSWFYEHLSGSELTAWEMLLVTSELATNAARAARGTFRLRAWLEAGSVVLEVLDDGPGFDGRLPNPDDTIPLRAERGRGLYLVRSLTDECIVQSNDGGTVVRVRKALTEADQSPR